jgi:putative endonuclease
MTEKINRLRGGRPVATGDAVRRAAATRSEKSEILVSRVSREGFLAEEVLTGRAHRIVESCGAAAARRRRSFAAQTPLRMTDTTDCALDDG